MYLEDIEMVEKVVEQLKSEGISGMNRSKLIRIALRQFKRSDMTIEDDYR